MDAILVDDDSFFQKQILTSIVERNDHSPLEAATGHECLKIRRPDLIILNILMPDYDDCSVLKAARAFLNRLVDHDEAEAVITEFLNPRD